MANAVAERVRRNVCSDPFVVERGMEYLNITVSLGVATTLSADEDVEDLIKRADLALYDAKERGRNQVVSRAA